MFRTKQLDSRGASDITPFVMCLRVRNTRIRVSKSILCFVIPLLCLYVQWSVRSKDDVILILQWGAPRGVTPFSLMGRGRQKFIENNCTYTNCYVSHKQWSLSGFSEFDAVVFSGAHMPDRRDLTIRRQSRQKYIFAGTESAHNYRICDSVYDGFFNWTWTYRLDSDVMWAYIRIYDLEGRQVGPKADMSWPKLDPIKNKLKLSLESKNKVAAWFVSDCTTYSRREDFVDDLQIELELNYSWKVDVYGKCGNFKCPRSRESECFDIVKRDYFFYFSLENSFAEDYVTEKLLTALNNDAVPVVYGGADYSRFLPPGSYLDARELGVVKLAETMDAIYKNRTAYHDFFRWQNHFRYKHTIYTDVCNLCAALNDEEAYRKPTVYENFRSWWNDKQWDGRNC